MRITTTVQVDVPVEVTRLAAELAGADSDVQASFFNTFVQELTAGCETAHKLDLQCLWVQDKLEEDTKATLRAMSESQASGPETLTGGT